VLGVDDRRATPAERLDNDTDFQPTDRRVLYGHHFAAIAGAGPLVGPVLAAQMGYLPGTLWIVFGVILAGAVQDMVVLFFSMRRDGKSLGQMARDEIGPLGGAAALLAVFPIMIILLAVLALVVVNALAESPWGTFSLAMTIPIALFMGFYLRVLRPGRVLETVEGLPGEPGVGLVDVRSPEEYRGELLAPPHLPREQAQRPGHVPGARNIPWAKAVDAETGAFLPTERLRSLYEGQGLTPDLEVVAYCRIGERSAHSWFVLHELLGYPRVRNYDGSWTEWGSMVGVPIER
jgi:rhodanese-related sulfurtransferase